MSGGSDKRQTNTTNHQSAYDNRQDNSINGSTVVQTDGGDYTSIGEYTQDNSSNVEVGDIDASQTDNSIRTFDLSEEDNSIRIDNTDNSDRSVRVRNTDNSDSSVRAYDNSDSSVRAYDNSDRRVTRNTDNSLRVDNTDSSVDRSDRRVITTSVDGGAIALAGNVAGGALDTTERLGIRAFDFAGDAQSESFEIIQNVLSADAEADARTNQSIAGAFSQALSGSRDGSERVLETIIKWGGAVAALYAVSRVL